MRIVLIVAMIGFPVVGLVIAVAFWQSLTQKRKAPATPKGGRQMSVEFGEQGRRRGSGYEVREFDADAVLVAANPRTGKVRIAAARKRGMER